MNNLEALNKYFGHDSFRQGQEEIIRSIQSGLNVLAILPTGAGKSVCYQIPALTGSGYSIVISPLISLMKDQVDSLNSKGKIASFLNSSLSYQETESVFREMASGTIKLLYVSPERLESAVFAERIKNQAPEYLFVDEAHCISEWGHNFRPSYKKIKEFAEYISISSISAFTATATPEVVQDMVKQLGISQPKIYISGFERNNLLINVIHTKKKKEKCLELLMACKGSAIVYASSRKKAEEAAEFLRMNKINAAYYHAGLPPADRRFIQEDFFEDKIQVIAATNAFGMGIDKKDIRMIIHYNMPGSIENYYQEIGRAGRDGEASSAYLLYDDADRFIHKYFITNSHPDKELIKKIYDAVCDLGGVALGSKSETGIPVDLKYFSSYAAQDVSRGIASAAISALNQAGYIRAVSEFEKNCYLKFNFTQKELKNFLKSSATDEQQEIIINMLRDYGSRLFDYKSQVSLEKTSAGLDMSSEELLYNLEIMDASGIIEFSKPLGQESVILLRERVASERLELNYSKISAAYHNALGKLEKITEFAYIQGCRMNFILDYFGDKKKDFHCGHCDNCFEGNADLAANIPYIQELVVNIAGHARDGITDSDIMKVLKGRKDLAEADEYPGFGSCTNYSSIELKSVIDLMLSKGMLKNKNGKRKLYLPQQEESVPQTGTSQPPAPDYESQLKLFNKLKEVRSAAAKKFSQTANLICSDEVLRKITSQRPLSETELLSVEGFNPRMYSKIGPDILAVIDELKGKPAEPEIPSSLMETYKLARRGLPLKEIASLRKQPEAIISMQIETIIEHDPSLEIECFYSEGELEKINMEISKGHKDLPTLRSELGDKISFAKIRIALAKQRTG